MTYIGLLTLIGSLRNPVPYSGNISFQAKLSPADGTKHNQPKSGVRIDTVEAVYSLSNQL